MSGVAPRVCNRPRTFAGLKNSCMFGSAPCSSSSFTIARPVFCVRRVDGVAATVDAVALIDRGVERRFTEDVPLVDVGAGLDQLPRQVPVGVHDRHEQRRGAVGIRQVDVGLVLHQHVHARHAVLARGVEQRRQTAASRLFGRPSAVDVTLVVAIGRGGVDVGALGDEELHHLRMAARRRPHQRRLPAELLFRIDGGPAIQQQLGRLHVAGRATRPAAPSCRRRWATRRWRPLRAAPSGCRRWPTSAARLIGVAP